MFIVSIYWLREESVWWKPKYEDQKHRTLVLFGTTENEI